MKKLALFGTIAAAAGVVAMWLVARGPEMETVPLPAGGKAPDLPIARTVAPALPASAAERAGNPSRGRIAAADLPFDLNDLVDKCDFAARPMEDGRLGIQAGRHWARFDEAGFEYRPRISAKGERRFDSANSVRFRLDKVRFGSELVYDRKTAHTAAPASAHNVVEYDRGSGIVERYIGRKGGIEQVFVFNEELRGRGDLVVEQKVETALKPAPRSALDGALEFHDSGACRVRYGAATVADASGRTRRILPKYDAATGTLSITIPTSWMDEAVYPVTIDPLVSGPNQISDGNMEVPMPDPDTPMAAGIGYDPVNRVLLAAWVADPSHGEGGPYVVKGCRVHPITCRPLDIPGFVIAPGLQELPTTVRVGYSEGATSPLFLVVYDGGPNIGERYINCVTVNAGSPTPVVGTPLVIAGSNCNNPALAWDDVFQQYLVVYEEQSTNVDVMGLFLDKNGSLLTGDFTIGGEAGCDKYNPDVAFDGVGDFLVVWNRYDGVKFLNIYGGRVDAASQDLDSTDFPSGPASSGVQITDVGYIYSGPSVAADGTGSNWLVVSEGGGPDQILADKVEVAAGSLVISESQLPGFGFNPVASFSSAGESCYLVVASDPGDFVTLVGRRLDLTGSPIDSGDVWLEGGSRNYHTWASIDTPYGTRLAATFDGDYSRPPMVLTMRVDVPTMDSGWIETSWTWQDADNYCPAAAYAELSEVYLVAWQAVGRSDGVAWAVGARLDKNGNQLDGMPLIFGPNVYEPFERQVSVATDGQDFLAIVTTYEEGPTVIGGTPVLAVSPYEDAIPPEGILLAYSYSGPLGFPALAWNDTLAQGLVVYEMDMGDGYFDIYGQRFDHSLNLVGAPILIASGDSNRRPRVAAGGSAGWCVVHENYDSGTSETRARYSIVNSAGGVTVQNQSLPFEFGSYVPDVAFNGANYVAAWRHVGIDGTQVRAARITPAGTLLDAAGIPLITGGAPNLPAITSVGSACFVVCEDWAAENGDLRINIIAADGRVADPFGELIIANAQEETYPCLAPSEAGCAIFYEDGGGTFVEIFGAMYASVPIITTPSLPPAMVGAPYNVPLQVVGGIPPYSFSLASGSLPPGLRLNAGTGVIDGATAAGSQTFNFAIRVTDSFGANSTKNFSIFVRDFNKFTPPTGLVATSSRFLLDFDARARGDSAPDSLIFRGLINSNLLPPNPADLAGDTLHLDIGGAVFDIPLNAKGVFDGPIGEAEVSLKLNVFNGAVDLRIRGADLASAFGALGAYNETVEGKDVVIPVTWMIIPDVGEGPSGSVALTYSYEAVQNERGVGRFKRKDGTASGYFMVTKARFKEVKGAAHELVVYGMFDVGDELVKAASGNWLFSIAAKIFTVPVEMVQQEPSSPKALIAGVGGIRRATFNAKSGLFKIASEPVPAAESLIPLKTSEWLIFRTYLGAEAALQGGTMKARSGFRVWRATTKNYTWGFP
ncbi:MAG: Ig domain-containing protein [Planctomycetota bacterium]|nr:Ig domain-containing protein [Planctomycetota bacterium]